MRTTTPALAFISWVHDHPGLDSYDPAEIARCLGLRPSVLERHELSYTVCSTVADPLKRPTAPVPRVEFYLATGARRTVCPCCYADLAPEHVACPYRPCGVALRARALELAS